MASSTGYLALALAAAGAHVASVPSFRQPAAPRASRPVALAPDPFADRALTPAEYSQNLRDDEADVGVLMAGFGLSADRPASLPQRGVFCTRELDLRGIKGIGYDMDYTLIDYKMVLLEERVYHYSKEFLRSRGFPVSGLRFSHELVVRGLIVDTLLGHVLKVDRFGHVRRAMHGTRVLSQAEIVEAYGNGPPIDLRDERWRFLNTLFSVSEGCLYAQLGARRGADAHASRAASSVPGVVLTRRAAATSSPRVPARSRSSRLWPALHRLQGAVRCLTLLFV